MKDTTFPIIPVGKGAPHHIPWDMIKDHDAQARLNHCGQSLALLARRGGLAPDEALAVLDDRNWWAIDNDLAAQLLNVRIKRYESNN